MASALGDLLKRARGGRTQEEVADELEVTQPVIHKWESGEGVPDLGEYKSVAKVYGISATTVLNAIVKKAEERARERRRKRAS